MDAGVAARNAILRHRLRLHDLLQYSGPIQLLDADHAGPSWRLPDVRSLTGAVILFSFVFYPYVYLMTRTALAELSISAVESARLLGQSRWGVFWRVVRPLIMPSIVAGAMLVLMETLADVGATYYFGLTTFSAGIYKTWFAMGSRSAALMLAVVLLVAVAAIYVIERRARGRAMQVTSRTHRPWTPDKVAPADRAGGSRRPVPAGACRLRDPGGRPAVAAGTRAGDDASLGRFWLWAGNSFVAGLLGATVTLLLAIGFAYAARFSETLQAKLVGAPPPL